MPSVGFDEFGQLGKSFIDAFDGRISVHVDAEPEKKID